MKFARIGAVCLLGCVAMSPAVLADADKSIKYRQGVFRVMAWDFGTLGAMVKGKMPFDAEAFAKHAVRVANMPPRIVEGFGADTAEGSIPTRAKAEIWSDMDGFKAAADKLTMEANKLAGMAATGDEAALKAQFGAVGKTCKGCHDDYRADKK